VGGVLFFSDHSPGRGKVGKGGYAEFSQKKRATGTVNAGPEKKRGASAPERGGAPSVDAGKGEGCSTQMAGGSIFSSEGRYQKETPLALQKAVRPSMALWKRCPPEVEVVKNEKDENRKGKASPVRRGGEEKEFPPAVEKKEMEGEFTRLFHPKKGVGDSFAETGPKGGVAAEKKTRPDPDVGKARRARKVGRDRRKGEGITGQDERRGGSP